MLALNFDKTPIWGQGASTIYNIYLCYLELYRQLKCLLDVVDPPGKKPCSANELADIVTPEDIRDLRAAYNDACRRKREFEPHNYVRYVYVHYHVIIPLTCSLCFYFLSSNI